MAETNPYNQTNHALQSLFAAIDPKSLILSQNSNNDPFPNSLQLTTTDSFIMERGPRYKEYAQLRESKLRRKYLKQNEEEEEEEGEEELQSKLTPPKKTVRFQGNVQKNARKIPSILAQSVPDFSSALRKENRKPPVPISFTPPSKSSRINGSASKLGGSKSESPGNKRNGGGLLARKSHANFEELKGLSSAVATAINRENRGGVRSSRGMIGSSKTVLGYRQF